MKQRSRRLLAQLIVVAWLATMFASLSPVRTAAAAPETVGAADDWANCVAASKQGALLILMDESASLKRTDPENRRVGAVASLIGGLVGLGSGDDFRLQIQVAGFASSFEAVPLDKKNSIWRDLGPDTEADVRAAVSGFVTKNNYEETDYYNALNGARAQIESLQLEPGACSAIIWVSDGSLDIVSDAQAATVPGPAGRNQPTGKDYAPGMSSAQCLDGPEPDGSPCQLESYVVNQLCNEGGIADHLRDAGIWLFGFGLGNDAQDQWALMRAIAEESDYPDSDGGTCGTTTALKPPGTFWAVDNSTALTIALRKALLREQGTTVDFCPNAEDDKCGFSFQLRDWIQAAQLFVIVDTTRVDGFQVLMRPPGADFFEITSTSARKDVGEKTALTWVWDSPGTVTVKLAGQGADWAGSWDVKLIGTPKSGQPSSVPPTCQVDNPDCPYISFTIDGGIKPTVEVLDPDTGDVRNSVRAREIVDLAVGLARKDSDEAVPPGDIDDQTDMNIQATLDVPGVSCDGSDKDSVCEGLGWDKAQFGQAQSVDLAGASAGTLDIAVTLSYAIPPLTVKDDKGEDREISETRFQEERGGGVLRVEAARGSPQVKLDNVYDVQLNDDNHFETDIEVAVAGPGVGFGDGCLWLSPEQPGLPGTVELKSLKVSSGNQSSSTALVVSEAEGKSLRLHWAAEQPGTINLQGTVILVGAPCSAKDDPDETMTFPVPFKVSASHVNIEIQGVVFLLALIGGLILPLVLFQSVKWRHARLLVDKDDGLRVYNLSVAVRGGRVVRLDGAPGLLRNDVPTEGRYQDVARRSKSLTLRDTDVRLEAKAGWLWEPAKVMATAPGRFVVAGSGSVNRTLGSDHHGELPLAVADTWLVVVDPAAPDGEARVVLIANASHYQTSVGLMANEVATIGPELITELSAVARGRSAADDPNTVVPTPDSFGGVGDQGATPALPFGRGARAGRSSPSATSFPQSGSANAPSTANGGGGLSSDTPSPFRRRPSGGAS
ncbi:MAG: hypothetical protein LBK42_10100 [Propionibacteriaceae bacterium]|jgi:hypothetical protein|nr:hypothetical protein [Propionibacteriaceae bacterium]